MCFRGEIFITRCQIQYLVLAILSLRPWEGHQKTYHRFLQKSKPMNFPIRSSICAFLKNEGAVLWSMNWKELKGYVFFVKT